MKQDDVRHHRMLLDIIDNFRKVKWGRLISRNKSWDGLKVHFKPVKKEFKVRFTYDRFASARRLLEIGQTYNNIQIQFKESIYVLETVFLGNHAPPKFTGSIDRIHTKGFSEKRPYYYRLIVPLERDLRFHYNIQNTSFSTDLGYRANTATTATIHGEDLEACCIHRENRDYYLVIDSIVKQGFKDFAEKVNAIKIAIGYLSGYYVGNQGFFFAYTAKQKKVPKHFRCLQFRDSIKSGYVPVHSNAYGYMHGNPKAKEYQLLLRPVSLTEFSLLCEKIHDSIDFSSAVMLMLESSIASLLFMPGGYAIALEAMSDLIIGKTRLKLAPIKTKRLSKKIRKELQEVIDNNSSSLHSDDLSVLKTRINQINQTTNKSRLKAPFILLGIDLLEEDLKILETRNDFLHGRIPDLTDAGDNRTTERKNKDLYYASVRLYTLLNMLILKWIGYDNRVVNLPKIQEDFTLIKLEEEPFRQV